MATPIDTRTAVAHIKEQMTKDDSRNSWVVAAELAKALPTSALYDLIRGATNEIESRTEALRHVYTPDVNPPHVGHLLNELDAGKTGFSRDN